MFKELAYITIRHPDPQWERFSMAMADKRRAWQRELLAEEITRRLQSQPNDANIHNMAETILSLTR